MLVIPKYQGWWFLARRGYLGKAVYSSVGLSIRSIWMPERYQHYQRRARLHRTAWFGNIKTVIVHNILFILTVSSMSVSDLVFGKGAEVLRRRKKTKTQKFYFRHEEAFQMEFLTLRKTEWGFSSKSCFR
jgi:hypothetical protein